MKYCFGKTPMQTWKDSLHLAKEKLLSNHYQKFVPLTLSDETKTGSGGDQPERDNLTDRNENEGNKNPSLLKIILEDCLRKRIAPIGSKIPTVRSSPNYYR